MEFGHLVCGWGCRCGLVGWRTASEWTAAFRWLRDHYRVIQVGGGLILVALGLLLFFHRDWWLRVFLNRLLNDVGLGDV